MEKSTEHGRIYTFPKIDPCENRYLEQVQADLLAYRASGLTPDELPEAAALLIAKREGMCGIPPVKLHQHIFRIFDGEILEETVCDAMWEPFKPRSRWKVWVMGSGLPYYWNDVFGKTVFLTRADAEAALQKGVAHDGD